MERHLGNVWPFAGIAGRNETHALRFSHAMHLPANIMSCQVSDTKLCLINNTDWLFDRQTSFTLCERV